MKTVIAAFTQNGAYVAKKLADVLGADGYVIEKYVADGLKPFKSLTELVNEKFDKSEALVFVGACGIAVRAIAPHIKDKATDPAVVVIDEKCKFVIPILSGHIGGANELARRIAKITGASPVITTATDINDKFAVDVFAVKNKLHIADMEAAKLVSAELLQGRKIGLYSDFAAKNTPDIFSKDAEVGICISHDGKKKPFNKTLNLIPQNVVLGVGCKKGKADIISFADELLTKCKISREAVCAVASIDLKKDEGAIISLCEWLDVPFLTYTASYLAELDGDFSASEFVKKSVGVDNVCERAVCAAGAEITVRKTAQNGVTLALGIIKREIDFNEGH